MTSKPAVVDKNKAKESPIDSVLLALASFLEQMAKEDAALSVYNTILKQNPNSVGALIGRGMIQLANGEPETAMRDFTKALARAPRDRNALRAHAFANMLNASLEAADKDFQKSFNENAEWDSLTVLLAYILKQKDEPEQAAKILNDALDGKIKQQDWPYALLQFLRGDIDMTTVMSIAFSAPRQLETRAYLGFCKSWGKNPDEGKADLLFVRDSNKGSPMVRAMADCGIRIIEEGLSAMIARKEAMSNKTAGMDWMN